MKMSEPFNNPMRNLFFASFCILLTSCTKLYFKSETVDIINQVEVPLLSPESFKKSVIITQAAEIRYQSEVKQLLFQIEINPRNIIVVGLTPGGTRLFTMTYDGKAFTSEGVSAVVEKINPRYLLADIQFSLWDLALLKNAYGKAKCFNSGTCRLSENESGATRRLAFRGNLALEVNYTGSPDIKSKMNLEHKQRKYQLIIENLSTEIIESKQ